MNIFKELQRLESPLKAEASKLVKQVEISHVAPEPSHSKVFSPPSKFKNLPQEVKPVGVFNYLTDRFSVSTELKKHTLPFPETSAHVIGARTPEAGLIINKQTEWGVYLNEFTHLKGAYFPKSNLAHKRFDAEGLDLSFANLSGANLKDTGFENANLEGINLQGAYLKNAVFKHVKLHHANLANAKLDGAYFGHVGLDHIKAKGVDFRKATLEKVLSNHPQLRNAYHTNGLKDAVYSSMSDKVRIQKQLAEISPPLPEDATHFIGARLPNGKTISKNTPLRHVLDGFNQFKGAYLKGLNLSDLFMENCDLSQANLKGADLHNSYFHNVDFTGANLTKADCSGAVLKKTRFNDVQASGINVQKIKADSFATNVPELAAAFQKQSHTQGVRSELKNKDHIKALATEAGLDDKPNAAHLLGVTFPNGHSLFRGNTADAIKGFTELREAHFPNLVFYHGDFSGANLTGANFRGSKFSYTHFTGANLTEADFSNANLQKTEVFHTLLVGNQRYDRPENDYQQVAAYYQDTSRGNVFDGANLTRTNMTNACFPNASFKGATIDIGGTVLPTINPKTGETMDRFIGGSSGGQFPNATFTPDTILTQRSLDMHNFDNYSVVES
jgi:uncharacterized protein YjbI with pentapeptide repeats